jgi:hypothetical protein
MARAMGGALLARPLRRRCAILSAVAAPPRFTDRETPREIVDAAGEWLAAELGNSFRWVPSSRALKAPIAPGRTIEVRLRPSHWNYSGVLTVVGVRLTVRDSSLARWRRGHGSNHSGLVTETGRDVAWSQELSNLYMDLHNVELYGDLEKEGTYQVHFLKLAEFLDALQKRILPKLLLFDSPVRAARELPDIWLADPGPLIDWATSLGEEDSARLISTRSDKLHRRVPPDTPLESVLAAARELLEMLQSELHHFREYRDGNLPDEVVSHGIDLTLRWIGELSDPEGHADRVPDGALTRWASSNLGPPSPIRQKAIDFETAAMPIRNKSR